MPLCGHCGGAVADSDRLCATCGTSAGDARPAGAGAATPEVGMTQPPARPGRRFRGPVTLLVSAAVLVGIVLLSLYALTSSSPRLPLRVLDVTSSRPPGLLTALHRVVRAAYPISELSFTYSTDPNDTSWVSWRVQGAPGYRSTIQPGDGYAHRTGSQWKIWGPGTNLVGCSSRGSQGAVPASVLAALGTSCGSTS